MKKRKTKEQVEEFKKKTFLQCPYCGYQNEKYRLNFYKACLKCHKPLGDKNYFKNTLLRKMGE